MGLIKREQGRGGAAQPVRENYISYPVSRTTSEQRAERWRGWGWGSECGRVFF